MATVYRLEAILYSVSFCNILSFGLCLVVGQVDDLLYSQGIIIIPPNTTVAIDEKPFLIFLIALGKKKKAKSKGRPSTFALKVQCYMKQGLFGRKAIQGW